MSDFDAMKLKKKKKTLKTKLSLFFQLNFTRRDADLAEAP